MSAPPFQTNKEEAPVPRRHRQLGVGEVDMDPFPGGVHVGGGGTAAGPAAAAVNNPQRNGNLVGPMNPMFHPLVVQPKQGPRFDPFGPVPGKGNAVGGEPDPDHLMPFQS